jgi:hypothetical protein
LRAREMWRMTARRTCSTAELFALCINNAR